MTSWLGYFDIFLGGYQWIYVIPCNVIISKTWPCFLPLFRGDQVFFSSPEPTEATARLIQRIVRYHCTGCIERLLRSASGIAARTRCCPVVLRRSLHGSAKCHFLLAWSDQHGLHLNCGLCAMAGCNPMTDPNGAAIYGNIFIPSTNTTVMLALIYQHHGSVMGYGVMRGKPARGFGQHGASMVKYGLKVRKKNGVPMGTQDPMIYEKLKLSKVTKASCHLSASTSGVRGWTRQICGKMPLKPFLGGSCSTGLAESGSNLTTDHLLCNMCIYII